MRGRFRVAACAAALAALIPASVAVAAVRSSAPQTKVGPVNTTPPRDPAGILRGAPVHGMVVYDLANPRKNPDADLVRLKADGINTLLIYIYVHTPSLTSNYVESSSRELTDNRLIHFTQHAHQMGMAVEFDPVLVVDGPSFVWRGYLKPTSIPTWFRGAGGYNDMIIHYSQLAEKLHVELFSMGSELSSLQNQTTEWSALSRWLHRNYHGIITYQSTGGSVFTIPWLSSVDVISVSIYYSLTNWSNPNPTLGQLVYTWRHAYLPKLASLAASSHRQIIFAEVGYCSSVGATVQPAHAYSSGAKASQDAQATAYNAVLSATRDQYWLRGIAWWHWDTVKNPVTDTGYSMRDKKAECVVAHFWSPQAAHVIPPVDTTGDICLVNHVQELTR